MCKDNIGVPLNASTQPYLGKDWERGYYAIAVKHNRPEELRCLYLLSYVKREFGDDLWKFARWQLSYQGFGSEVPSRSIAEAIIVIVKHIPAPSQVFAQASSFRRCWMMSFVDTGASTGMKWAMLSGSPLFCPWHSLPWAIAFETASSYPSVIVFHNKDSSITWKPWVAGDVKPLKLKCFTEEAEKVRSTSPLRPWNCEQSNCLPWSSAKESCVLDKKSCFTCKK